MRQILKSKEAPILGITILLMIVISIINPVFIRIDNVMDVLKSNSVLGIIACGMLLAIITGGIDLSVSAMIAACTVIVGNMLIKVSDSILLVFVVSVICGGVMGLINGLLVSRIKIPPIVVTLGTMSIFNGIVRYTTNGKWITDIPKKFLNFGRLRLFNIPVPNTEQTTGIPIQIFFTIAVALLTWFILKYTLFGRGVYSIGGNLISAERIGYNIKKIQMMLYAYIGMLAGLAGVVHNSIMVQVDPNVFGGFEMQVVAAVVLGGANIAGGYGSVFGTMIGVVFLAVSNNGLVLMKIPTFWQQIVVGSIIVIAVSVDAIQRTSIEKRRTRVDVE